MLLHAQVVHRPLRGRSRDFGMSHSTMTYGGLQAFDGQSDVWAIRDLGGSLGMGQRHFGMRDHHRSVPHPTVADCLRTVLHGLGSTWAATWRWVMPWLALPVATSA